MLGLHIQAALMFEITAVFIRSPGEKPAALVLMAGLYASPHLLLGNPFESSLFESDDVAAEVQRIRLGRIRSPLAPETRYGPSSYRRWPSAPLNCADRRKRFRR